MVTFGMLSDGLPVPQPTLAMRVWAMLLDSSAVMKPQGASTVPLCRMARCVKGRVTGDSRWTLTAPAPALSPNSVSEFGSPPKAAMLSLIHSIAIAWSKRP